MVDSDKRITNLHVPNNVIIDASVPNVIRDGGKMWNRRGQLQDTIALIPDRCYATMYQEVIADCMTNGQFDPATMGSVSNVGLMAKKAEEYGSHGKTFEAADAGTIKVTDDQGNVFMAQAVEGETFSGCARPRTWPSGTGSNWESPGSKRPDLRLFSGLTQTEDMMRRSLKK